MEMIENRTAFFPNQLIRLAGRENNPKRGFLLVNPLLAKHMPAPPGQSLALFTQLGERAASRWSGGKTVVMGFAETATALGAAVALCFPDDTLCLQTTREPLPKISPLAEFQEEHSHAVEQLLYCEEGSQAFQGVENAVFVDDEFTTGKTILNCVESLGRAGLLLPKTKILALSLVNGMSGEEETAFAQRGISWDYLVKLAGEAPAVHPPAQENRNPPAALEGMFPWEIMRGKRDLRQGVRAGEYRRSCEVLAKNFLGHPAVSRIQAGKVLVLGTEEFMYPALFAARELEKSKPRCMVRFHATTRSPILPWDQEDYPIQSRVCLPSLYDAQRTTYLYNLAPCDLAVVFTDAEVPSREGTRALFSALRQAGAKKVLGIQWGRDEE